MSITYDIGHSTQGEHEGRHGLTHRREPKPVAGRLGEPAFGVHAPSRALVRLMAFTSRRSAGWLGRRVTCLVRRHGARVLTSPVDAEVLGVRMRLHAADNACEKRLLFTPHYVDPAERALLTRQLQGAPQGAFTFVDIGANAGLYTLAAAAQAGPGARILAVEPHPELARRLAFNLRSNGFEAVEVLPVAAGDLDGEITLFLDADDLGQANVKFIAHGSAQAGSLRVPVRTLETLLQEAKIDRLDALKLDASGAEDLVLPAFLRSAPVALWPGLILLANEASRWHEDMRGLLSRHGYAEVLRTRANLAFERR